MLKNHFPLFFLVQSLLVASLCGQALELGCGPEINPVDFPAKEQYIDSKRSCTIAEKLPEFKISGDIRTDFLYRRERQGKVFYRGGNSHDSNGIAIPSDLLAVKMNLRADYVTDRTWCVAQVEFDNNAGIEELDIDCKDCTYCPQLMFGSGFCDYLCLKRAYAGMVLWKCEDEKLTGEIGRRALYYVFDSRVQYKARVDGVFMKYSNTFAEYEKDRSSNFFVSGAYWLVNRRQNHFSYAFETGVYNICDTGFDSKASFINWRKHGKNECGIQDPLGWRFTNVQVNLDYNFKEKICGHKLNLYSAFLINLAATREAFNFDIRLDPTANIVEDITVFLDQNPHKENKAWYIGFIYGEVKKEGDFSFDCNYQYVEAAAVPECDIRGIGRGNSKKETFTRTRRGNSNYKGLHTEFLYAITDRFQIDITFDTSRSVDQDIGDLFLSLPDNKVIKLRNHIFSRFELELIHAF